MVQPVDDLPVQTEADLKATAANTPYFPDLVDAWHQWLCAAIAETQTQPGFRGRYVADHLSNLDASSFPSAYFRRLLQSVPLTDIEQVDGILRREFFGPALTEFALGAAVARYVLADDPSPIERDSAWSIMCHLQSAWWGFHEEFVKFCGRARPEPLVEWARFYNTNIETLLRPFDSRTALEIIARWNQDEQLQAVWNRAGLSHVHFYFPRVGWVSSLIDTSPKVFVDCLDALGNAALVATLLDFLPAEAVREKLIDLLRFAQDSCEINESQASVWNRKMVAALLIERAIRYTDTGGRFGAIPARQSDDLSDEAAIAYARELVDTVNTRRDGDFLIINWLAHLAHEFTLVNTREITEYAKRRFLVSDVFFESISHSVTDWSEWITFFGIPPASSEDLNLIGEKLGAFRASAAYAAWLRSRELDATPLVHSPSLAYSLVSTTRPGLTHLPVANWRDWRLVHTVMRATDSAAFWKTQWIELEPARVISRYGAEHHEQTGHTTSLYWIWIGFLSLNVTPSEQPDESYWKLLNVVWHHAKAGYLHFPEGFRYKLDGSLWSTVVVHLTLLSLQLEKTDWSSSYPTGDLTTSQVATLGGDTMAHAHVAIRADAMGISPGLLAAKWASANLNLMHILTEHLDRAQMEQGDRHNFYLVAETESLIKKLERAAHAVR